MIRLFHLIVVAFVSFLGLIAGCEPSENATISDSESAQAAPNVLELDGSQIRILSWNVESEGSDPQVIAKELADFTGYGIVALSEVLPEAAEQFCRACGNDWKSIVTRTGHNDRLQIVYDDKEYELVRRLELHEINDERHRSPLVAHLRIRSNGREFLVMNNHLARGNADFRTEQARRLVDWAREQTLPVLAVGDYNFDYHYEQQNGNDGFRAMLRDNIWRWVEPQEKIDSNWYDPEPDGMDNYPGSLLDFAFVAGPAKNWNPVCRVIARPKDFPDDETTSDHRPIELIVTPD